MRTLILFISIAACSMAAAAGPTLKDKCKHDKIKDDRIAAFFTEVEKHPYYLAAAKNSALKDCKNLEQGFNLIFKNGDRIEYRLSDIVPAVEYFFAKPWEEQKAFELAKSALTSVGDKPCFFKMNEPNEIKGGAKVYWCEETAAISVTFKSQKATQIRRWTVH